MECDEPLAVFIPLHRESLPTFRWHRGVGLRGSDCAPAIPLTLLETQIRSTGLQHHAITEEVIHRENVSGHGRTGCVVTLERRDRHAEGSDIRRNLLFRRIADVPAGTRHVAATLQIAYKLSAMLFTARLACQRIMEECWEPESFATVLAGTYRDIAEPFRLTGAPITVPMRAGPDARPM